MSKRSENLIKLREMSLEHMVDYLNDVRKQLFMLRLSTSTEHVKDVSQFKKLRREIARVETCIRAQLSM